MRFMDGRPSLPVVGARSGHGGGRGGLELLLGRDVVVAGEGAALGPPEVRRRPHPGGGGTLLGTPRTRWHWPWKFVLTGDTVHAGHAPCTSVASSTLSWPSDEVVPTALAMAQRIAANGPLAVRRPRKLTRTARWTRPPSPPTRALAVGAFGSEDARAARRRSWRSAHPTGRGARRRPRARCAGPMGRRGRGAARERRPTALAPGQARVRVSGGAVGLPDGAARRRHLRGYSRSPPFVPGASWWARWSGGERRDGSVRRPPRLRHTLVGAFAEEGASISPAIADPRARRA